MPTIPLKAYRLAPRKPSITVHDGVLTFRFPLWFGGRTFSVPVTDAGVVDLRLVTERPDLGEVVYKEPVEVPYVYTTSPATAPNMAVVFREPVALPAFRWLVRQQASDIAVQRSARGARPAGRYVDGVLVRAVDPTAAVDLLAGAGVERVVDPDGWLHARRAVVTDPARVAEMESLDRRFRSLERVTYVVAGAGAATFAGGQLWLGTDAADAGIAVVIMAVLARQVVVWRSERAWFRPRNPE